MPFGVGGVSEAQQGFKSWKTANQTGRHAEVLSSYLSRPLRPVQEWRAFTVHRGI